MNPLRDRAGGRRVVLAHDWLTGMRGGERVLELLCQAFPEAPLATLLAKPESVCNTIRSRELATSMLQHVPGIERNYRYFLPLFPLASSRLRVPEADLMISTSHCVAKSFRPPPGARHVCYCFTPMRYAWLFHDEYLGRHGARRLVARPMLAWLRRWDRRTSARVDRFVAISEHVRERIRRFYGRDSSVVYPPVDTRRCTPGPNGESGKYDLIVSALVPYKRVDLAVRAYARTGFPLRIVGIGSERTRIEADAPDNVSFLGWRDDAQLTDLYRGCRLLVFPGHEDFGIVPLEAQACGRPVVAFGRGGALETILDGVTGVFFEKQTEEALADAVERAAARKWDSASIRTHAERFGVERFIAELADTLCE